MASSRTERGSPTLVSKCGRLPHIMRKKENVELTKLSFQDPPWLTKQVGSNGTVTYRGNIAEFANYIAQAFNAT